MPPWRRLLLRARWPLLKVEDPQREVIRLYEDDSKLMFVQADVPPKSVKGSVSARPT